MHSPKGEATEAVNATHERTSMSLDSMYGISTHRWTKHFSAFGVCSSDRC